MKSEKNKIINYKLKRDGWREAGNKFLETMYQILIVRETEKSKFFFRKKGDLKQHWYILHNLLDEILGINDVEYHRGIYYEVILAATKNCLSGKEEECQICSSFFEGSENQEYVHGAYQLHISSILEMAREDVEAAQIYADNLLTLLKMRYGTNSWQYAMMKLHIIGEFYYWYKREEFLYEIEKNYTYFKKYVAKCDTFFCQALALCAYLLGESADMDYELWLTRCEEAVEQKQGDRLYCLLKCMIAWVKARVLTKQKQDSIALGLLQENITKYLEQDYENNNIFYGYVYLMAANICFNLQNFAQMIHYAEKGLAICEQLKRNGSELYYNLYNYVGVLYMVKHSWGEAEKLYGSSIEEIEQKFGNENENYITYISNLALSAFNQGKDPTSYLRKVKSINNEYLRKKFRAAFNNELNYSIARGDSVEQIGRIYRQCIKNMEGEEDKQEQKRLDTLYLSAMANASEFNEKTLSLLEELEESYKNNFTGELAVAYWNSTLLWEWKKGNWQTALEISERIMQEVQESEYEKYRIIIMNDIQLLIISGQYAKAKKLISSMRELFHRRILDNGYGNITIYLLIIQLLISMYIEILKREGKCFSPKEKEIPLLLENIMYCKTIERELKGSLGKYKEDDQMDMYYFKQAHRKLAALEMGVMEGVVGRAEYERKRMKCQLELTEHEANLNSRTPFDEMIRDYRFADIKIPHNTVCVEYFAYYNFQSDVPMLKSAWDESENETYSYLALVLSEDKGQAEVLDIINIPLEGIQEEEVDCLLDATKYTEKYDGKVIEETIRHLKQVFAMPVLKYTEGKKKIYLGLDFLQQMLPMDLIFCDRNGEPMDIILVDSVCYVEEDTRICMEESNALVVGNPQLKIHGEQRLPSLPCGEIECIKIAEMFGTNAYVGKEAKQKILWGKEPRDVIHISTHGVWRNLRENILFMNNLFTDSFLKLAGFEDWESGKRDKDYGNGIVSGDDFLFMDLAQTKLVVLSACVSGLGNPRGLNTMHGMRWALGAAGAKNSITALWEVSDDATAILMILFYRNLRTMPIGEALWEAKKLLRTITIGELRKDSVLKQIAEIAWESKENQYGSDDVKPYAHWKYWAGFVCYHR